MKRLALAAALLVAACGSAPQPVAAGERLQAGQAIRFRDDEGPGRESAFSPDGRRLVASGDDGTVTVWTLRAGTE